MEDDLPDDSKQAAMEDDLPDVTTYMKALEVKEVDKRGLNKKLVKEGEGWDTPDSGDEVEDGFGEEGRTVTGDGGAVPPSSNLNITLNTVSSVTDDKKVVKKILTEGEGYDKPNEGAIVKLKLSGKLQDDTIFIKKGYAEGEDLFEFKTCDGHAIQGLDRAVLTMKKGEVALLTIAPEYAFGSIESKQDLAVVPPKSTVYYEVELVSFEKYFSMDLLHDFIIWCILSHVSNAKDVAVCNSVCKSWKMLIPYLKRLFFPRETPEAVVGPMVSSIEKLEDLIIYCPFSSHALSIWLSIAAPSLNNLELIIDNMDDYSTPSKVEVIKIACNLESLKLTYVMMNQPPKWNVVFHRLKNLEIVGAALTDASLLEAIRACPYLTHLVLVGCLGLMEPMIDGPHLDQCKLDFSYLREVDGELDYFGSSIKALVLNTPMLESLQAKGCENIHASPTPRLKHLCLSAGTIGEVNFEDLVALETLSIIGVLSSWDDVSSILHMAYEVKCLYMQVEAIMDHPEIDFVDFFNNHRKLQTLQFHGDMFDALCKENSLRNVYSSFLIPSLEEIVISIRLPHDAKKKMETIELLLKCSKNLKRMIIIAAYENDSLTESFDDDICRFQELNSKIVSCYRMT